MISRKFLKKAYSIAGIVSVVAYGLSIPLFAKDSPENPTTMTCTYAESIMPTGRRGVQLSTKRVFFEDCPSMLMNSVDAKKLEVGETYVIETIERHDPLMSVPDHTATSVEVAR